MVMEFPRCVFCYNFLLPLKITFQSGNVIYKENKIFEMNKIIDKICSLNSVKIYYFIAVETLWFTSTKKKNLYFILVGWVITQISLKLWGRVFLLDVCILIHHCQIEHCSRIRKELEWGLMHQLLWYICSFAHSNLTSVTRCREEISRNSTGIRCS